jgi:hypothetical protein
MIRAVITILFALGCLGSTAFAQGQAGQVPIQFRLTSAINAKVDYYRAQPGGSPAFVGSVEPGATVEVESREGQVWLFAVNRVPFQQYTVRGEKFQHLTLAPKAHQRPPQVANEYQGSPDTFQPPETMGSADESHQPVGPADASGLTWQYGQFGSASDQGGPEAQLVLGIPETDAVQFFATCNAGRGGAAPEAMFSSDVSRLPARSPVQIRFSAPGFDQSYNGVVGKDDSGEGMQGVLLALPVADPLWQALSRLPALNYAVGGQPAIALPLGGVASPLGHFLRDCASFARGGAQTSGVPAPSPASSGSGTATAAAADSCTRLATARAKPGGKPMAVTFVNRTPEFRFILMVDDDGTAIEFAHLQEGESFKADTTTTTPWMMTDGPGNCIEMMVPSADRPVFAITRLSPGFGPE